MDRLDLLARHKALEHRQSGIVGALVILNADSLTGERDGGIDRRIGPYEDRLIDHRRSAGHDRSFGVVVSAPNLPPLASAIDVGFALLEGFLVVGRADEMVVAAAWIVPIELGLDPGGDDLELKTFLFGGVVARHEPVQPKHCLSAFNNKLISSSGSRCHCVL